MKGGSDKKYGHGTLYLKEMTKALRWQGTSSESEIIISK